MSFIIVLILSMFAADLLWWTWAHLMLRPLRRARLLQMLLALFMAMQFGCLLWILGGRFVGERMDQTIPRPVLSAVFIWHFILLPVAVLLMSGGLISSGAGWVWRRLTRKQTPPSVPDAEPLADESQPPTRRDFLRLAAVSAPPVATVLLTGASSVQLNSFRIRRFDVPLIGLPHALDGLTIAHVSDVHVGRFTSGRVLQKIVDATNNLRADLVLLTGDLINHALSDLPAALDAVLRMDARHGVYMCEGNHDLMESRLGFEQGVRQSGVPLLVNESRMLKIRSHDVQLLGLRWGPGRGDAGVAASMRRLLTLREPQAFPILLAHHPHAFDPAAQAGIPLTLAGHTHGGQLMASEHLGFGPLMFRYWTGLYERGDSRLSVSNGVGNWFPIRVNAPAEIIHLTLRRTG